MVPGAYAILAMKALGPEGGQQGLSKSGEKVQAALDKRWEFWHGLPEAAQVTLVVLGGLLVIRVVRGVL